MTEIAYTHIQSKIKIDGHRFTLMRGMNQKFPLSMLLYIVATEVLANFNDADKRIKGIQIEDYVIKLVTFVDDTTIFLGDIT